MAETVVPFWYAFVKAAPDPEVSESVNVGIVIGNGKVFRLEYEHCLPRLAGIVARDEIGVYEAMLAEAASIMSHGIEAQFLEAVLGPQLQISEPRALLVEPSEALIRNLRTRYLSTPQVPYPESGQLLEQRAKRELDKAIIRTKPAAFSVVKKATPRKLYEARIDRHVHYRSPSVSRAVRGDTRDLLLDSVLIDPHNIRDALRTSALRISRAFFDFGQLREVIRKQAGREIRRTVIIYPGEPSESEEARQARNWARTHLKQDAERLIEASGKELDALMEEEMSWVKHVA